jgi:hypothetical protein
MHPAHRAGAPHSSLPRRALRLPGPPPAERAAAVTEPGYVLLIAVAAIPGRGAAAGFFWCRPRAAAAPPAPQRGPRRVSRRAPARAAQLSHPAGSSAAAQVYVLLILAAGHRWRCRHSCDPPSPGGGAAERRGPRLIPAPRGRDLLHGVARAAHPPPSRGPRIDGRPRRLHFHGMAPGTSRPSSASLRWPTGHGTAGGPETGTGATRSRVTWGSDVTPTHAGKNRLYPGLT